MALDRAPAITATPGMCPVGVATQDPELEKRMHVPAGAERVARYLTAMTMESTALAKACGKSSVHNLETRICARCRSKRRLLRVSKWQGSIRPSSW